MLQTFVLSRNTRYFCTPFPPLTTKRSMLWTFEDWKIDSTQENGVIKLIVLESFKLHPIKLVQNRLFCAKIVVSLFSFYK